MRVDAFDDPFKANGGDTFVRVGKMNMQKDMRSHNQGMPQMQASAPKPNIAQLTPRGTFAISRAENCNRNRGVHVNSFCSPLVGQL
jgi:hypothetical protein